MLFITNQGKSYWVKVHEIPESSRQAKGQSIKVLLSLGSEEEITAIVNLRNFTDERFVLMATRQGVVKKVAHLRVRERQDPWHRGHQAGSG